MKLVLSIFLSLGFLYITYGRSVRKNRKFNSTKVNSTKRDGAAEEIIALHSAFTKNTAMENAKYFAELIGKVVGVAAENAPVVGEVYSTMVQLIYEFTKKEEKSVFEKIEDRVRGTIRNEVTNYHFDNMFGSKVLINAIVKEEIITKAQWFMIKSEKYKFLPQLYRTLEYSKSFFPEWEAYTLILMAATNDLISKGELGKCAIVNEMKALKSQFENGIKSLQLKRWRMLEGHSYTHNTVENDKLLFKDRYDNSREICEGRDCEVYSGLSIKLDDIGDKVFEDAEDFLNAFNEMAKSVAADGKYCFDDSCECGDYSFPTSHNSFIGHYPDTCMGSGGGKRCEFPCDTYGYKDKWCIVKQGSGTLIRRNNNWVECTKPDWNTCFKITPPYLDGKE